MSMTNQPFHDLLDSIAAKTPTPGGGAVASITAALACALGRMVLNYSVGKKSLTAHESENRQALGFLEEAGRKSLDLAEADARAYAKLNELWKIDPNDERRRREFPSAVEGAIAAPRSVMESSLSVLELLVKLPSTTNVMLHSDLAIAAILADTAVRSAAWNVRINLPLLEDAPVRAELERTLARSLDQSVRLCQAIEQACKAKPASA
jgi:formiminotetrahydrofolate cyclodeaminase